MTHHHDCPEPATAGTPSRERGSAMIMALGILTVLALLATLVITVAISGKRTAFSDFTGSESFYSADAASEAGVNWLKHQYSPAAVIDTLNHVFVAEDFTSLGSTGSYQYDVTYLRRHYRPGWSVEYKDYDYGIDATGRSAPTAASTVRVNASRLYREGY